MCVSAYACQYPTREDIAESFVPYLAVTYRPDRITPQQLEAIRQTIPNRIDYFGYQGFDMYPITP